MALLPTHSPQQPPQHASVTVSPTSRMTVKQGVQFLLDDNDFAAELLKKEVEAKEKTIKTMEALIIVGAFIAGVQAQVNASTLDKNDTNLQIAANGFGFVGLALDVLGTTFGVIHSRALQRSIRRVNELRQSRSAERFGDMIKNFQTSGAEKNRIFEHLSKEISERRKFWVFRRYALDAPVSQSFRNHLQPLFPNDESTAIPQLLHLISKAGVEQSTSTLGQDPLYAMAGGVLCLLMSVLIFAAYSQPRSVWLASSVITAVVGLSMVCSLWLHDDMGRKQRLLREMDAGGTTVHLDDDTFDASIFEDTLLGLKSRGNRTI